MDHLGARVHHLTAVDRFRDFDAALAESEPLTFKLGGTLFTCLPEIPAGPVLRLARHADTIDAEAFVVFHQFLLSVIVPEQRDALELALDNTGLGTLLDLIQWLIEEATGRPLPGASSLPEPVPEDGQPLRVVSLDPVSETG